jgi:hypothetical protein
MLAPPPRHLQCALAVDAGSRHDLRCPLLGRLELQQQEQPLEDRHLGPVLGEIEPPGNALFEHLDRGAAVIEQEFVESPKSTCRLKPCDELDQDALSSAKAGVSAASESSDNENRIRLRP